MCLTQLTAPASSTAKVISVTSTHCNAEGIAEHCFTCQEVSR